MSKIIEYVEFKANKEISQNEVIEALRDTDNVLDEIQGFEKRELATKEDSFIEIVYWTDQASAMEGLEKFKVDTRSQRLFELIDPSSIVIRYLNKI